MLRHNETTSMFVHCHLQSNNYNTCRFLAVFIYGRRTHSVSASACSIVPNVIWKGRSSKRGPISSKVISPFSTFFWYLGFNASNNIVIFIIIINNNNKESKATLEIATLYAKHSIMSDWTQELSK